MSIFGELTTKPLGSIDLQLFAGDEGGDGGQVSSESQETQEQESFTKEQVEELQKKWQEEFELKHQAKLEEAKKAGEKEGERLSKLSEQERKKEEENKKITALEEREKAIEKKERLSDIREELSKRDLPLELAEFFLSDSSKKSLEAIQIFQTTFQTAVEEAMKNKIQGISVKVGDSKHSEIGRNIAMEKNAANTNGIDPWK